MNLLKTIFIFSFSLFNLMTQTHSQTQTAENILSFSGGGSFGAVEIGILSKLLDDNKLPTTNYDLYTGISAGGLNAGFLSHYDNLKYGLQEIKQIYSHLSNRDIYELRPLTGVSLLNTEPLKNTVTNILSRLKPISPSNPRQTMIGTTNLNTGFLDTYFYNQLNVSDQIQLLLCTSAIPVAFPPISFRSQLYVDGGEIQNQLLDPIIKPSVNFINVTYITPYDIIQPNYNVSTFEEIVVRNIQVVTSSFNNGLYRLNQNCNGEEKRGMIYMYYVDGEVLKSYSMLNFNKGEELINIGYNNVKYRTFNLC
jgi:predicted acylesterase/phospholipase RssA